MTSPIIEVKDITKRYRLGTIGMTSLRDDVAKLLSWRRTRTSPTASRDFWALRGVSFSVLPGEVVGIIGRNGAGKSTLLKILSRITSPTAGEIRLRGRVASLLEVGTGFHPELSGRENIFLNGSMLGMRRAEIASKFDAILAFSEIEKFIDTPVKRYSSGMYVKLAFSVAAHLEPEILVIDEVLAVGDIAFQRKCIGRMSEVARSGRTVLFVSHNFGLVQTLCSHGVYLSQGVASETGPIAAVLKACLQATENLAGEKIADRPDRSGTGETRLVSLSISPISSQVTMPGCGLKLVLRSDQSRERAAVVVRLVDTTSNQIVLILNSAISGERDKVFSSSVSSFECVIDELPLSPGRYRVDVELWVAGAKHDSVESAEYLEVLDGPLDGRMIRGGRDAGILALRHAWQSLPAHL